LTSFALEKKYVIVIVVKHFGAIAFRLRGNIAKRDADCPIGYLMATLIPEERDRIPEDQRFLRFLTKSILRNVAFARIKRIHGISWSETDVHT